MKLLRLITVIVTILNLTILAAPAFADVKVKPRDGAELLLKAEKKAPPSEFKSRTAAQIAADPRPKLNAYGSLRCIDAPEGGTRCFGTGLNAPPPTPTKANITDGLVLNAARTIGLPTLKIQIEPGAATLVNLDTIFHANPQPFSRTIDLLGFTIDLVATSAYYTWRHGDRTSQTTRRPGRPYPNKDITHRYKRTAKQIAPSVDVSYSIRYRVDGGTWQTIGQQLVASGPTTDLEVKEATALLAH